MASDASLNALLRLQTFLNASFPIGAFSCSHGMESAIQDGSLHDAASCQEWIDTIITSGSGWNDAVLLSHAYRLVSTSSASTDLARLRQANELALALQACQERWYETTTLGSSFLAAAQAWPESALVDWHNLGDELALPVVIGILGALHNLPGHLLIASALQSSASNLVWIATRLVPLGQSQSLSIIASLESSCACVADKALQCTLDDLGSCALLADMAAMQHETLHSRVCRT